MWAINFEMSDWKHARLRHKSFYCRLDKPTYCLMPDNAMGGCSSAQLLNFIAVKYENCVVLQVIHKSIISHYAVFQIWKKFTYFCAQTCCYLFCTNIMIYRRRAVRWHLEVMTNYLRKVFLLWEASITRQRILNPAEGIDNILTWFVMW